MKAAKLYLILFHFDFMLFLFLLFLVLLLLVFLVIVGSVMYVNTKLSPSIQGYKHGWGVQIAELNLYLIGQFRGLYNNVQ